MNHMNQPDFRDDNFISVDEDDDDDDENLAIIE